MPAKDPGSPFPAHQNAFNASFEGVQRYSAQLLDGPDRFFSPRPNNDLSCDSRIPSSPKFLPHKAPLPLRLSSFLSTTRHNFDLLCMHRTLIIQLEIHILDCERPHLIHRPIHVQMPFEIQPRFDLLGQDFCEGLVEAGEHFHGGLGLDTALLDELVEGVDEGEADAAAAVNFPVRLVIHGGVGGGLGM